METQTPVIINGAGPVGLSLSILLARCGVASIVLEKKSALDPHSRALGILPRTVEILRDLGLLETFLETGVFISRPQIWMPGRTTPVGTINLSPLEDITALPGVLLMPQDQTERLLLEAARREELIDVRFGHEMTDFHQDGDGVTATVQADGVTYELRGSYLAGCDGAHSVVREKLGWHLEGKTYPSRVMLADIALRDGRDKLPWPRVFQKEHSMMAGLRYSENHWRIIHTLTPEQSDETVLSPAYIESLVTQLYGPGEFETVWKNVFRIHCRRSARWVKGRVMLCGDAAHLNSPAGGQGMNSGIQDAHNLSWKLAAALRGGNAQALLSSYETERSNAVQFGVERYTDLLTRAVLFASRKQRVAFLAVASLGFRLRAVRKQALLRASMLDVAYPRSALLRGGNPLVGKRAPDGDLVRGDEKTRLLDTVFPNAAILLFDDGRLPRWDEDAVREALPEGLAVPTEIVRILSRDVTAPATAWRDVSGRIWKQWGLTEPMAAIVRPDGHIAWVGRRPTMPELREGLKKALGVS